VSAVLQHDCSCLRGSLRCNHGTSTRTPLTPIRASFFKTAGVICFVVFVLLAVPHALDQRAIPMPIVKGRRVASLML
jgi:hypothetical protein